ncbi:MAG: Flp pilus assembly protein TadB [Phenylobacterium sp.]|nr:Flp pilus assembly protein TadB [Phenylobacterium sp.]
MSFLIAYLAVVIAIGLALQGAWLLLRSLGREARSVDRRLAQVERRAATSGSADFAGHGDRISGLIEARWPGLRARRLASGTALSSAQLLGAGLGAGLALAIAIVLAGAPFWLGLAIGLFAGVLLPPVALSALADRRRKAFLRQMPQAVELMARSLQAGHPVTTAMAVAAEQMPAPLGTELRLVLSEMSYGQDRDAALRNLLQRMPVAELQMFIASLEVTRETGGNLAEVLVGLAEAMRAKAQLRRKAEATSAEGRLSFYVISALPLVVVLAIVALRPGYYQGVIADPLFWPLMSIPPTLWLIGAAVIWRMVNFRI